MSNFDLESPQHDIFVSVAVNAFLTNYGGSLSHADGRVPLRNHAAPTPPIFFGYRPDAIISRSPQTWFVEVKSYDDLFSPHTKQQFQIVSSLIHANEQLGFFLMVFGARSRNSFVPPELLDHVNSNRLVITYA